VNLVDEPAASRRLVALERPEEALDAEHAWSLDARRAHQGQVVGAIEAPVIRRTGSGSPAMAVYASAARSTLPRRTLACAMLSRFITLLGSLQIACSLMASASSGRLVYRQSSAN
jgi:hypothetical protein